MTNRQLWLRWSWRDLRERWLQVAAIALIIALGTGVYAGMGSSTPWREHSYDSSYALLNMYDLRIRFTEGTYLDGDELFAAVNGIEHADWITAIEPRLITSTLAEVTMEGRDILVPGRIMGVDVSDGGPHISGIHIKQGRALETGDAGANRAVLEYHFASHHDLPPQGTIQVSGGVPLDYVGQGMTPEYFMVISGEFGFMEQSSFAVIMVPLETAQTLSGHPGQVNDLVLTLAEGADRDLVRAEIAAEITEQFAGVGTLMQNKEDDTVYNTLYGDLEGDDQVYKLIAYLFLAGAAFGTFNLTSRIVEAQRRQIGIGMALGVPRHLIAVRPLLVGAQIALLGVVFGAVIGYLLSRAFAGLLQDFMPMPVFETAFQVDLFLTGAALGVVLPFVATLYPVWRAVRVPPVDAIKTGYLVAKGGGLVPFLANLPVPGKSFTQMPIRNLLRAPRRTLLTLLGVGMAITTLIAITGMLDTFITTIDEGKHELLGDHPQRMTVTLNTFLPVESEQVAAIRESSAVSIAEPGIIVGGELRHSGETIEVSIELIDLHSALWTPTVIKGSLPSDTPGILINQKAADDLGVKPGDTLTLRHPQREGLFSYRMVDTEIEVRGIHANPLRFLTYMDKDQAGLMGLQGLANVVYVNPADGTSQTDVQRAMFQQPGVASVQPASFMSDLIEEVMDLLIAFISVVVGIVMVLAFLIAFNSTSINVDERAREIATLFAFGLPIRTVVRMTMLENLVTGILGTLVGIGLGFLTLTWMLDSRIETMMPEIDLAITVSPLSLAIAVILGVVVVALTPLFSIRKMMRMNLPSTLRVME